MSISRKIAHGHGLGSRIIKRQLRRHLATPALAALTMAILMPVSATADQWWSAVGWTCDQEMNQLTIYPVRFDANDAAPRTRDGLFVQTEGLPNPKVPFELLNCPIKDRGSVSLHRIHQNIPKARGACGGAPWAEYDLRIGEQSVATFHMGCGDAFAIVNQNNVFLCALGDAKGCRSMRENPLRLNWLGKWVEE